MEEIFIFHARISQFGVLLGVWKFGKYAIFQHNIFKLVPTIKKTQENWCEYHYNSYKTVTFIAWDILPS